MNRTLPVPSEVMESNDVIVGDVDAFIEKLESGFYLAHWEDQHKIVMENLDATVQFTLRLSGSDTEGGNRRGTFSDRGSCGTDLDGTSDTDDSVRAQQP